MSFTINNNNSRVFVDRFSSIYTNYSTSQKNQMGRYSCLIFNLLSAEIRQFKIVTLDTYEIINNGI